MAGEVASASVRPVYWPSSTATQPPMPRSGCRAMAQGKASRSGRVSGWPGDGWPLLAGTARLAPAPAEASARLSGRGWAPPPRWSAGPGRVPAGNRYLRLVFGSEPVEHLAGLRARFAAAF